MPFVESFLTTIKNNKSIKIDKSKHFRKTLGGFEWSGKNQFNFPEATPEQLNDIKEKIHKENKIRSKLSILLIIIAIALLWVIMLL